MFEKYVKEVVDETRELTGGWLEEFSEAWSEGCPCLSEESRGGLIFLRCIPPVHLLN